MPVREVVSHDYWRPWQYLSSCGFSGQGQGCSVAYQEAKSIEVPLEVGITFPALG